LNFVTFFDPPFSTNSRSNPRVPFR
jgi:hypothetical protein